MYLGDLVKNYVILVKRGHHSILKNEYSSIQKDLLYQLHSINEQIKYFRFPYIIVLTNDKYVLLELYNYDEQCNFLKVPLDPEVKKETEVPLDKPVYQACPV